ncbi:DUF1656 domain-containing protein [Frateuria terrea]|uniref:DUF1656 domain-containing protein n=1 Tax=Frateuria terrea TaxID=529704 RepID=A0A1H6SAH6_9GAMM|nr:DUF1656 domain-containing protein [Frateuria terrea]SEI65128.1 Protein of unknown function [Frateuria terrea]SFP25086.1 Protein of unknown function [Frateuria terrea]
MPPEIEFYGVLVPGLLPVFLLSLALMVTLDLVLGRAGLYRRLWHPSLFRFALFVCLFGAAGLLLIH